LLSVGGIPNRTTICSTISPLGGGQDDTVDIQNAIEACPLGQVVMLAAGIFTIAEGKFVQIDRGITLRGVGPGRTILQRTDGAKLNSYIPGASASPMIIVGPTEFGNTQTATVLTADAAAGAYSIEVASTAGFSVGQVVLLDEASGAGWQPDIEGLGQVWASSDYRVVWQKHNPPQLNIDDFGPGQYPYTPGSLGCAFSNCDRATAEMHQISAISGKTITFDSPVTISYRVSHQAQLHYFQMPVVENAGVEDMTLEYGDDGNLQFLWTAYSWAKNVESTLWLDDGVDLNYSFRDQIEGMYIHNTVWPVPGGGGYAISSSNGSSENLIENSISLQVNKVIVERASGAGSVVAYNYMDDGYIEGTEAWIEIGLNGSHFVGSHHTLFEANWGFNIDSDNTHGNAVYHTFFRNWATGFRSKFTTISGVVIDDIDNLPGNNGPLRAAGAHCYSYWNSFIGNVLGTSGRMNGWSYDGSFTNGTAGIWLLGWSDLQNYIVDRNVSATAILDGNFDYVTNSVVWAANDTSHALPNSLYLTREPAFFNAGSGYTWPWVDPTKSPRLYTLPAKARYDAGTPFTQP
jgi:hypothetical protein